MTPAEFFALPGAQDADWWLKSFSYKPNASEAAGHRCGERQMLMLVAYDITDPKRLHKVAQHCLDYGMRVQFSVFECRLDADRFDAFWSGLVKLIDTDNDRIVAYHICNRCAKEIRSAGQQIHNEKVVAYFF